MATHINTTNAIKGLTCAANSLIPLAALNGTHATVLRAHVRKHLVAAGIEIERLNNEAIKLRRENSQLKEKLNNKTTDLDELRNSYEELWQSMLHAVAGTDAGRSIYSPTDQLTVIRAVAAIKKTEADRKEALRTAEAFQKAQSKAVPTSSFSSLWEKVIDAVSTTAAGEFVSSPGVFDCALETERAIAAINKTEADRRKALRTAEAFQKAQSKAEPTEDIFSASRREFFTNYFPAPDVSNAATNNRIGLLIRGRYRSILTEIIDEAVRASEIHPKWPTDALHAVSILSEKSGDLTDAAVNYHYHDGDLEAIRHEAIQTGAMALCVLLNIDKYKRPSDEK